jgi:predicted ABC-type ATPase
LQNVELAKERVKTRVIEGGHNIEVDVIERRYIKGIVDLFEIYLPIVDEVLIFDNSNQRADLIAEKLSESELTIIDNFKFNALKKYYERA